MLFPILCLTNGLGCKNPGKDLAAELLPIAPHGSQDEGAELQVPPSWCARGQDSQEEMWPGVHTQCSAPTPTLLPWSQEKPFGSSRQDTAQGKP